MSFRASDWTILGDVSVRNVALYEKKSMLPLDGASFFAASMFGGPIAIAQEVAGTKRGFIDILSSNGMGYATINEVSNVHSIYWTKCHKLIIVQTNGRILLYSALGILLNTITIDQDTQELGVSQTKSFNSANTTGLALLNNSHHIFAVNSINDPVIWRVSPRSRTEPPTCWAIISRLREPTRVLICVKNQFFYGIQSSTAQPMTAEWVISDGQYLAAEPNYDHSFIALFNSNGFVQIISSDLETELHRLNTLNTAWNNSIIWCGNNVIGLRDSPNSLQLYSMLSNSYKFTYKSKVHTEIEPDGIKTFTRDSVHLITVVPDDLQRVLGVASTHPGAFLYEASLKLIERSHLVYECIKLIGDRMQDAIDQCLACAAHHFDVSVQKSALRAANIGKAHYTRYDSAKYVEVFRTLRVLNEIRRLGIPISYAQLNELKISPALIDRLIDLKHWPMAIKICDYLEYPLDDGVYRILGHWAAHLMETYDEEKKMAKNPLPADLVADKIFKRLERYPGISYADIAEAATKKKLNDLAEILLNKEPNIERQVSMLLKLNKTDEALRKATQSHQPNLLQIVISHLKSHRSKAEVDMILSKIPQALRLYQGYIREEAPERALSIYIQQDDFVRQALHYLDTAFDENHSTNAFGTEKVENLVKAEKSFNNMKETVMAQLLAFAIQLMKDNTKREEEHHVPFTDKNLRETVIWCVSKGDLSTAESLKKHYKLTDKQFWYWTIEAFAQAGKWNHFEQFGRAKKSPIGYLPFIETSVKYGNRDMAAKFMDKIIIYEEQVKANLCRGNVIAAATLATEKKDVVMLRKIFAKCRGQQEIRDRISAMIQSVSS